ncbi:type I polyketide synthase [Amycolatopsis aidingensis]|uniref:type I polyketide synthase n=1 Tax=Amycolatopsis aidingensis TaxID=2842453 RepID=UPI001C0D66FD|nr:type I polyketide synthase [Amycolatopsis aidingensis]
MSTLDEKQNSQQTLKRALLAMERMQRQLAEYERAQSEPIAIVGVGCRFPGGVTDPDSYWKLLSTGVDAITEVPADRWDADAFYDEQPRRPGKTSSRWGGFLDHIDRFDHEFFGISLREAVAMDPQQRLALEVVWEALENAGQDPTGLAGSQTGVYLGVCSNDYAAQTFAEPVDITGYTSTGTAHSVLAGRISYLLDLRGASVAVDTACSSSLVAVHQACQSLRAGEIDLALGGGVNAILSPQVGISFSQFPDMLAADGRCKTFDASANGFVRSEGCGVLVLKRLSDAERDGDQVLAVLRGSAVNQDGRSSGVTAPNGAAQRDVLRRALRASGVRPEQVSYIETHGTGTKLGDPIEVEALGEVYGRAEGQPVLLGSAKTNIGHLEAAAGAAGLIKAALCVSRGAVPPNLHFTELNPHISLAGTSFAVPTELSEWDTGQQPRMAGVSSFGFSGTNVHMLVEQPPTAPPAEPDERRPASVLALSAKSEKALAKLARRYQDRLGSQAAESAADLCFSANTGRAHFRHRLAVLGRTGAEIADQLRGFVRGDPGPGVVTGTAADTEVVFLFTGQGPQRVGMARELYETQPAFRRTMDRCAEILDPVLDEPLLSALYSDDPQAELADQRYAQTALFAVEYATAQLWQSWGVQPAAVLGHSLGEYAAACFAGAMSLEDGLRLTAERGRLMSTLAEAGVMATISAPATDVEKVLVEHDPRAVSVAAVNGPENTVVSGAQEAVHAVCAVFAERGVETRQLRIPTPFHSPLIEPIIEPLRAALRRIEFHPPRIPVVSGLTGELLPWDEAPDADYWCRHAREPVLFAAGAETLHHMGYRTFLEVGPNPTLLGLLGESLPTGDTLLLPSLRPKQGDWEVLLGTVARLYAAGAELDWAGFDREYTRNRVTVPLYPFDATRCWHEPSRQDGRFDWNGLSLLSGGRPARTAPAGQAPAEPAAAPAAEQAKGWAEEIPTAEDLLALPAAERLPALVSGLLVGVRAVLGGNAGAAGEHEALSGFGLDSLMAVELRNEIQNRTGVSLRMVSFLKGATVTDVATEVLDRLAVGEDEPEGGPAAIPKVERAEDAALELLRQINAMPDEQVTT